MTADKAHRKASPVERKFPFYIFLADKFTRGGDDDDDDNGGGKVRQSVKNR